MGADVILIPCTCSEKDVTPLSRAALSGLYYNSTNRYYRVLPGRSQFDDLLTRLSLNQGGAGLKAIPDTGRSVRKIGDALSCAF